MTGSVFGEIVVASQIEDAFIAALKKWFPSYLSEIERNLSLQPHLLVAPRNYTNRNSFDAEKAEEIPKVVVISPGLAGQPQFVGRSRTYTAPWRVGVGVMTAAKTEDLANTMVKSYAAAARGIILKSGAFTNVDLGIRDVSWTNESYDDILIPDPVQLYKAAAIEFQVIIESVVAKGVGPAVPTVEAETYPQVETVDVELTKED